MRTQVIFICCLLLAGPGLAWQALEMYVYTLMRGPQMLFFSVAHTMPLVLLFVFLAIPFGVFVVGQSAFAFLRPAYLKRPGISKLAAGLLVCFVAAHFAALATYESWSSGSSWLRQVVCAVGLLGFVATAFVAFASVRGSPPPPLNGAA